MSRSLNKVMLIGNLGADPEIRSTPNGQRVAQFSVATSRSWNDAAGQKQEKTEWHRCVVWNRGGGARAGGAGSGGGLVDVVERYLKKGDKVYVEGSIEYRQWQDKEGQTKYTTEIKVNDLQMLGGRAGGMGDEGASAPRRAAAPARAKADGGAAPGGDFEDFPGGLETEDDDLPF
jgi:single-strand DNA-binding protein